MTVSRGAHALLALAAVAVAFAAADTYVVVLALPDMMASAGISVAELQRAAPIVSGFLLGYVAMLPLIGRIADLRGRVPVLVAALVVFSLGSLVTALAYDLPSMVAGRFLQGVGGGGLVPATLALVADLYPPRRRGVPLGLVSAVQEVGAVLGPLVGALVLAVADWRAIFALNLVVGLALAVAVRALARRGAAAPAERRPGRLDWLGLLGALATLVVGALVFLRPPVLLRDLFWGQFWIPFVPDGRWLSPVGTAAAALAVLTVLRWTFARRPLVDVRGWGRSMREADLVGSLLLAAALAGVILTFATADPEVQVVSDRAVFYVGGSVVALVALVLHLRRSDSPLLPRAALRERPAWGAMVVSFLVGAALIAALIDIPLFARTTIYPDSQLMAALVLVRFLVALSVGAVLGGWALRVAPAGVVTAAGMVLAAVGFAWMSTWGLDSLEHLTATVPLVIGGLGFGLALAPVSAAVLAATEPAVHGVASALVVVARMIGMLVGISALTTLGLRRFYAEREAIPPLAEVCGDGGSCPAYTEALKLAGIAQEQTVFLGAAVCALLAAVLALVLLRGAPTRDVSPADALRAGA